MLIVNQLDFYNYYVIHIWCNIYYYFQYLYDLLDALITVQTSPDEAEVKLDALASRLAGQLRTMSAKVQEFRSNGDQAGLRKVLREYESTLEK